MNKQLPLIVRFEVKFDKIDFVKSELLKILGPTRKEKGLIQYDLHRDLDNPTVFMFYEIWETEELWKIHNETSHIKAFSKAIEGALEKLTISKLEII